MPSTLLVADPSPVFRRSLRQLLRSEAPEWRIAAEATSGPEVLDVAERIGPDAVLLERRLEAGDGLEVLSSLRRDHPGTPVLMIGLDWEPAARDRALELGAAGVLLKRDAADRLARALRRLDDDGELSSDLEPGPG